MRFENDSQKIRPVGNSTPPLAVEELICRKQRGNARFCASLLELKIETKRMLRISCLSISSLSMLKASQAAILKAVDKFKF